MTITIVDAKLYIPPARSKAVAHPRLLERLNEGLQGKLTILSAAAGYGKTTLASEWLSVCGRRAAWLSLDAGDNDPARFLTYLFAACRSIGVNTGESVYAWLQSPQPPPIESLLTALLNEISSESEPSDLVLDDYHVIDAGPVNQAVVFLIEHLPPQMHLIIATREDPVLPLPRLRVRHQLTELRSADLRFNASEAAEFLGGVMGLALSAEDVMLLESRTEGWVAGLQKLLAAFAAEKPPSIPMRSSGHQVRSDQPLFEKLSGRELEVLLLIAQGLSNREIGDQLFLALSTVKGYNRNIFDKLQVSRRTEAIARARTLGIL